MEDRTETGMDSTRKEREGKLREVKQREGKET